MNKNFVIYLLNLTIYYQKCKQKSDIESVKKARCHTLYGKIREKIIARRGAGIEKKIVLSNLKKYLFKVAKRKKK